MKKKISSYHKYAAVLTAVLVTTTFGGFWGHHAYGASPITDPMGNTYSDTDNTNVTGTRNSIYTGKNIAIVGNDNTIKQSNGQTVIGDNNKISNREYDEHIYAPIHRSSSVTDLTIGKGNIIKHVPLTASTNGSLTVIGNNNKTGNISSTPLSEPNGVGIVLGDNQNIGDLKDTIIIGSLSPEEQAELDSSGNHVNAASRNSTIIGYHSSSNSQGNSVVIGNRSRSEAKHQVITGHGSVIKGNGTSIDGSGGSFSTSYGSLNLLDHSGNANDTGSGVLGLGVEANNMANSVMGSMNTTKDVTGAMIVGGGNLVSNSRYYSEIISDNQDGASADYFAESLDAMAESWINNNHYVSQDEARREMQHFLTHFSGGTSILGNGNTVDYAVRSQILGTNNTLTGEEHNLSGFNNIHGYGNEGTNIKHSTIMGASNSLKNSEDNVVIGDFHNFDGSKHNVVLGSMASKEEVVTKTGSAWDGTENDPRHFTDITYTVKERVPIRRNTANIENAVMLGYNTDVIRNGGVALGSESVASIDKGIAGYDPATGSASISNSPTWKSTAAAVSVGDSTGETVLTRQITNVAAGTEDTDAVNVAQLKRSTLNIDERLATIDNRIKRVGAGAAALAALHPQDFDPNDHWTVAAGYGKYRGANAMALGAFYRPNNKTLFSIGTSLGGGENLFNLGVSLKFGKSEPYADYSKAELIKVINDQNTKAKQQDEKINAMQEQINKMMAQLKL